MVTAERATVIADELCRSGWHDQPPCDSCARIALALIDTAIETLKAWRTEHRSIRTHWMEYGKSDDCHECVAIERELTRLRKEREALTAGSRTIRE